MRIKGYQYAHIIIAITLTYYQQKVTIQLNGGLFLLLIGLLSFIVMTIRYNSRHQYWVINRLRFNIKTEYISETQLWNTLY